ncbi:hypothetical protein C3468_25625 [Serratia marcescens]|nr:hypothetical protein C3468_25625 [Serratia marcescens]
MTRPARSTREPEPTRLALTSYAVFCLKKKKGEVVRVNKSLGLFTSIVGALLCGWLMQLLSLCRGLMLFCFWTS